MTGRALAPPAAAPVVAFGGDVILGERQNALTACSGPANALGGVPELAEADLVIVNLESVIASAGAPVAKGTPFPFYFRGRPELLAVLVAAGIDVVCTANNHSGDFGTEALLEQVRLLDGMNFGHAGRNNFSPRGSPRSDDPPTSSSSLSTAARTLRPDRASKT
jgi:hypothetical protein